MSREQADQKRNRFIYLTISLITLGFIHSLITCLNTIFDLVHDEEDNVIKNITVISLIFRFLIDLFFGLSFLALAYSFGIKRLEFQTNYLKKNGKFTTFVKEGSNEDTEFKGMSS